MGDGAERMESCRYAFSGAVQIVDLYRARQHLWDLARNYSPNDSMNQQAWMKVYQTRLLDKGKIEKLVLFDSIHSSISDEVLEKICTEAD